MEPLALIIPQTALGTGSESEPAPEAQAAEKAGPRLHLHLRWPLLP